MLSLERGSGVAEPPGVVTGSMCGSMVIWSSKWFGVAPTNGYPEQILLLVFFGEDHSWETRR